MDTYKKLPVYSGNEPYIFVSYAHKDSEQVLPVIEGLQARGFRVWFDQGIEVGTEWPQYIAEHLLTSGCVLAFLSPNSANSNNCKEELAYAKKKNKEMVVVYLEDFVLPEGLDMQLTLYQSIYRTRSNTVESFVDELANADKLKKCQGFHLDTLKLSDELLVDDGGEEVSFKKFFKKTIPTKGNAEETLKEEMEYLAKIFREEIDKAQKEKIIEPKETTEDNADMLYQSALKFYNNGDYEKAIELFRTAALKGNSNAQNYLGYCYYCGKGIERDRIQAVKWYKLSAEQGNLYAQRSLGDCYYNGKGVEMDYAEAAKWYRKPAEHGNAGAQVGLGEIYYSELYFKESIKWYKLAAEQGCADAQYMVGEQYFWGEGVKKNHKEAAKWYKLAAELGYEQAIKMLKNWKLAIYR